MATQGQRKASESSHRVTYPNVCSNDCMSVTLDPLARRLPAGLLIDSIRHEPLSRQAEIWCSDRSWRPCTVLAWASIRDGWAVLLRLPDGREGWYALASNVIRNATG